MSIVVILEEETVGVPSCQFHNPDHEGDALARLVTKLKDPDKNPDNLKIVRLPMEQIQDIEDQGCDLIVWRTLATAMGDQLDQYGTILGETRQGANDDDYRRILRVQILANLSKGTPNEITKILALLVGSDAVRYRPIYPAAFLLEFVQEPAIVDPTAERIARQIVEASPAGVGLRGIVQGPLDYWGFEEDPNASPIDVGRIAEDIAGGIGTT